LYSSWLLSSLLLPSLFSVTSGSSTFKSRGWRPTSSFFPAIGRTREARATARLLFFSPLFEVAEALGEVHPSPFFFFRLVLGGTNALITTSSLLSFFFRDKQIHRDSFSFLLLMGRTNEIRRGYTAPSPFSSLPPFLSSSRGRSQAHVKEERPFFFFPQELIGKVTRALVIPFLLSPPSLSGVGRCDGRTWASSCLTLFFSFLFSESPIDSTVFFFLLFPSD